MLGCCQHNEDLVLQTLQGGTLFWVTDCHLLINPHMVDGEQREEASFVVTPVRALIPFKRGPLSQPL